MKSVLFVCVENACRSQMAEAMARKLAGGAAVRVYSAGSRPAGRVHPGALASMAEAGYDLSAHRSKGLAQIPDQVYDVVVTLGCGDACPTVRARQRRDWAIADPGDLDAAGFRAVRDRLETEVRGLMAELTG